MILLSTSLEYLSTSYSMNFLALHDDVKFIIASHLASDLKIRALTMIILKMPKYAKYIKIFHIQEISYILVVLVIL